MVAKTLTSRLFGIALALLAGGAPAVAQGLFSPVLVVNDMLVTRYELDQRVEFLTLLGAQGDIRDLALNQLTVEALQLETATAAGFGPTPEAIEAGQAEFATRANLTRDEFIAALAQNGVDAATFRDFIAAGVSWRAYVQDRFRDTARAFPGTLLERAEETATLEQARRALLTEIILPTETPGARSISLDRARRFSALRSEEAFSEAARAFSQTASRLEGGEVDWRLVDDLPPPIAEAVRNLGPGQTSRPVDLETAIGVYFVRDVEITPETSPAFASVDYAVLQLPAGAGAEGAGIVARADTCEDLEGPAGRYPPGALQRQTTLLTALPGDLAPAISGLDTREATLATRANGAPAVVMVCARTFGRGAALDENRLRLGVTNERLQILAAEHLNDIRARAVIVRPGG